MAAWFDGIEVYVELSWGNGPRTAIASMAWTDYADDVVSIDVSRGSQSEFGDFPPGTATIVINDPGRVFDASNTAGPNYGEVVPMVPVRIRAVAGATSAALFLGYVASFALSWPVDGRAPVCVLTCVDGTRVLEAARLAESAYGAAVLADGPINYWPMQEPAGSLEVSDMADPLGHLVRVRATPDGVEDLELPLGQPSGRLGYFRNPYTTSLTTPATIEAWFSSTDDDGYYLGEIIRAAASDDFFSIKVGRYQGHTCEIRYSHGGKTDSAGASSGAALSFPLPTDDAFHVVAVASSTEINVYLNGQLVATDTLAAGSWTHTVFRAQVSAEVRAVSHVAVYSDELTAAQIAAHYDAGLHAFGHPYGDDGGTRTGRVLDAISHPSADRDIDAGSTVLDAWLPAGGDALSAIRETIAPEQALVYFTADGKAVWRSRNWQRTAAEAATVQATFGDQAGEIRYTDDVSVRRSVDDIYNHTTVSFADGSVSVEDATSIAAYGEQRESISATLIDDTHTARQLAAMRVREHKDAVDRIEALTVLPRRDTETVVATLLELDLGYRVAVNRRPIGGTGSMALEMSVRGITHHIDRSAVGWVSTLYLAPPMTSYVDGPWLTLGDADYGKIGAVAGNLIPY